MKALFLSALCGLAVAAAADDSAPDQTQAAPDPASVKAALNKTDVGFFLLLDKNDKAPAPEETKAALNKTDVGFFLLLDKNDKAPAPEATKEALNKTDVGFFLLLDKNDKAPKPAETQTALNKTDVGFFLLLDKNDKAPKPAETQAALNKTDVGFFLLLDKKLDDSTDEVELGRKLFFDPRLSANKTMACATCHNPSLAWRDGLPRARGLNGVELPRRTPTLLNVHHEQQRFFWDGRASSIEEASLTALQSRLEMNRDPHELVRELNRIPEYSSRFTSVYGLSGITPENISKAIASFVKNEIRPAPTPFDRFRDDPTAMSASAQRGLIAFTGKGRCILCHTGPGLSNGFFHNTGVKPLPGVEDVGRYAVVPNKSDYRAFKTVPLRNVALTAPYMHNGSLATLRDVVDFYDRGGDVAEGRDPQMQPLKLTEREKEDLVAFLNALTSPQKPVAVPVLPISAEAPSVRAAALWNEQRARMVEYDVKTQDRPGLAANAAAMRENVEVSRRYEGLDLALASACLDETESGAREVERLAGGTGPWPDAARAARPLAAAADRCAAVFRSPDALAAADRLLGEAEASIDRLSKSTLADPAAGARCEKTFSVDGFLADLSAKKVSQDKFEKIQPLIIDDLLNYHEFRALAAKDPKVCDVLAPLEKHYFGISRTAAWGCREWYWDMTAAHAMGTHTGDLAEICLHSITHDYPHMTLEDGKEVCGVIGKYAYQPEKLCRSLIPKFLGQETYGACVDDFSRYSRNADVAKTQSGVPEQLFRRYLALDLFTRAYQAKDVSKCGDSEICRAQMGGGLAVAKRYADHMRGVVCSAASVPEGGVDPAQSASLLDSGGELLTRVEDGRPSADRGAAREIDARMERLSRLRRRYEEAVARLPRSEQQGSLPSGADAGSQARAD